MVPSCVQTLTDPYLRHYDKHNSPYAQVGEVVKGTNGDLTVKLVPHTEEGKPLDIDGVSTLLWAVGRDANMVKLGIDVTNVELEKGFIKVDEYQNTSVTNMYALGDIAGKKLLTPGIALSSLSLSLLETSFSIEPLLPAR